MVEQLTKASYDAFVRRHPFAAVHFDADWDVGGRPITRRLMYAAEALLAAGGIVGFGEVDIDFEADLAKRQEVLNVPFVAYYRDGVLVADLIGNGQNIAERVRRVMRGEPIGYKDGASVWSPPPPLPT
jgi:thioredoxin-like negative regulator of GroEL